MMATTSRNDRPSVAEQRDDGREEAEIQEAQHKDRHGDNDLVDGVLGVAEEEITGADATEEQLRRPATIRDLPWAGAL